MYSVHDESTPDRLKNMKKKRTSEKDKAAPKYLACLLTSAEREYLFNITSMG